MTIIDRAREFAHAAHDSIGQKRKYSGEPYWVHTDEVAGLVGFFGKGTSEMIAAAHLHDVLEDVAPIHELDSESHPYGIESMRKEFGTRIVSMVRHLTDVFTKRAYAALNRGDRKILEVNRLQFIPNESKTIKIADLISNTRDIVKADPDFAVTYMKEKGMLLPRLKGGNETLYSMAETMLKDYYAE